MASFFSAGSLTRLITPVLTAAVRIMNSGKRHKTSQLLIGGWDVFLFEKPSVKYDCKSESTSGGENRYNYDIGRECPVIA